MILLNFVDFSLRSNFISSNFRNWCAVKQKKQNFFCLNYLLNSSCHPFNFGILLWFSVWPFSYTVYSVFLLNFSFIHSFLNSCKFSVLKLFSSLIICFSYLRLSSPFDVFVSSFLDFIFSDYFSITRSSDSLWIFVWISLSPFLIANSSFIHHNDFIIVFFSQSFDNSHSRFQN